MHIYEWSAYAYTIYDWFIYCTEQPWDSETIVKSYVYQCLHSSKWYEYIYAYMYNVGCIIMTKASMSSFCQTTITGHRFLRFMMSFVGWHVLYQYSKCRDISRDFDCHRLVDHVTWNHWKKICLTLSSALWCFVISLPKALEIYTNIRHPKLRSMIYVHRWAHWSCLVMLTVWRSSIWIIINFSVGVTWYQASWDLFGHKHHSYAPCSYDIDWSAIEENQTYISKKKKRKWRCRSIHAIRKSIGINSGPRATTTARPPWYTWDWPPTDLWCFETD